MDITLNLTNKQDIAFKYLSDNTTSEILFGGSAGGGKSFFGCAWLIINCIQYPGTRWLMGRAKLKNLKQTTLKTFFEICSDWKLTSEHYNYNAQNNEITFFNGSVIILKDLFLYPSDPNFDGLGSLEITGAFIDEVNQITEKAKNVVASRIRYRLDKYNLIPKMFMSCNPAKNWVYNEFYKKDKEGNIEHYKKFIAALVTDNPHISKHYITQLEKMDEISKKRLLYGQWEYEDKAALIEYDKIINIFKDYNYNTDTKEDYYISVDVARKGKDKAVMMVWAGYNIIKIHTMDISLINEIVDYINILKDEYKISNKNIVVDSDGVGGGVADYLRGCVNFVNNARALKNENYQNIKTQCYYKLSELINDDKINIFDYNINIKEEIIQELASIKMKDVDKDGKLKILGKEEVKSLIGRSPDYSDTMMMRMYWEFKNTSMAYRFA